MLYKTSELLAIRKFKQMPFKRRLNLLVQMLTANSDAEKKSITHLKGRKPNNSHVI